MFFSYLKLWEWFKSSITWVWEKITGGSDSSGTINITDNSKDVNLIGWKNQFGDKIVGQGFIDRREQFQVVSSGVDPRDIEKYLNLLDNVPTKEEKETQILDWYYTQEIDLPLKEALLIILNKLNEAISFYITFSPEKEKELPYGEQEFLQKSIEGFRNLLRSYQFDKIDHYITSQLTKLTDVFLKKSFIIAIGNIYYDFRDYDKAIRFYYDAFNLTKSPDSVLPYVNLAILLYRFNDAYEALMNASDMLDETPSILMVRIYERLSYVQFKNGRLDEAENYSTLAENVYLKLPENIRKENKELYYKILKNNMNLKIVLGFKEGLREIIEKLIHEIKKDYNFALDELAGMQELGFLFNPLSVYFASIGNWRVANNYSLTLIRKKLNVKSEEVVYDLSEIIVAGLNLVVTFFYNEDYEEAEKTLRDIKVIMDDYMMSQSSIYYAILFTLLGCVSYIKNKDTDGYIYFSKAFDILNTITIDSPLTLASIYGHIANTHLKKREIGKAKVYYRKVLTILKENLSPDSPKIQEVQDQLDNIEITNNMVIVFY